MRPKSGSKLSRKTASVFCESTTRCLHRRRGLAPVGPLPLPSESSSSIASTQSGPFMQFSSVSWWPGAVSSGSFTSMWGNRNFISSDMKNLPGLPTAMLRRYRL
uniref:(northern house mosquito) hypothetical protein n=1 Tax=Culex pipiens TaxID=7175 RepID=A0A8D8GUV9_CULPI